MNFRLIFSLATVLSGNYVAAQTQVLSVTTCQQLALEQNKKIKAARYQIDAAGAALQSAVTNAYPAIDGSVMGAYLGKPVGGAFNGMIPEYVVSGSISATQAIYAGGKIRNGKKIAEKFISIQEEQKVLTTAEVILNVHKAYWQVVQVKEKMVLADKYQTLLQGLQRELKNAYDAGIIYKNDLLRVEVNLNEAALQVSQAADGLVMAKLQLAQLTGMPGQVNFAVADSVTGDFNELTGDDLLAAADNRPEIRLLKNVLDAEELQKKLLKGDLLPTIGVSASGVAAAGKSVNISNGKDFMSTYYGLASISMPIFDWGKRAHKIKEQSFKIAARQQLLEDTKEQINIEVQHTYLALNQSVKKIHRSHLSLTQAEENLRLANDRFKAGTITGKDVLEAQAIWQQAYSSIIDSKVEYKINEAAYQKAIGAAR
ncbi:TolC family protein [Chitinophaga nivalis]|uniref:TolC family protein n=1 Tax=Chitinophaga nivalis TaxID=2991709 RepID=A0ABT3IQ40_9BACT|nr:TolC family protein [Chitinophaga nivalis]MCW3464223.1 TolC family protein [Chitinophaga nivalis]MCW3486087.1 TolC family protein [Chitinophaga nivalis]